MSADAEALLDRLQTHVDALESVASVFQERVTKPTYFEDGKNSRHRYTDVGNKPRLAQVLKAVRAVSGLNAAIHTTSLGYIAEAGIILRTVDDCLDMIAYIEDGLVNNMSAEHAKYLDNFFAERTGPLDEPSEIDRAPTVSRRKVQAAVARLIAKKNPSRFRDITKIVDDVYSGFVHASVESTVDLYDPNLQHFRMRGMYGTPRIAETARGVAIYTHRALNTFMFLTMAFGHEDLDRRLYAHRRRLEETDPYFIKPGAGT